MSCRSTKIYWPTFPELGDDVEISEDEQHVTVSADYIRQLLVFKRLYTAAKEEYDGGL